MKKLVVGRSYIFRHGWNHTDSHNGKQFTVVKDNSNETYNVIFSTGTKSFVYAAECFPLRDAKGRFAKWVD